MGLLDGDLASVFASAFAGVYLDATLHPPAAFTDDGGGGGSGNGFGTPIAVKAQVEAATDAMRRSEGFVDTDVRILVLAHGVSAVTTDHEITVRGQRWSIANVGRDPALAYFDLQGRKSANA